MEEVWKPAKGFERKFEVSNLGGIRVKDSSGGYKLHIKNQKLYFYISTTINGKNRNFQLHRIIYETFVGKIPEKHIIHHIDGNKQNNAVSNLQLLTAGDHVKVHFTGKPSWNKGLKTPPESHKKQWETRHKKYSTEERDSSIYADKLGGFSLKELHTKYKLSTRQILAICKQRREKDAYTKSNKIAPTKDDTSI